MRIGPPPHTVDQVTNWLAEIGHLPTAVVMAALGAVMLLDAIPLIGVLIPGDVAVLGAMAARGPAGGAGVLLGVIAGCLAGWSASFLVGRYFGARLRRGRIGSWIGEARWQAAERAVGRTGGRMVMIAPFLPVLNALVPLAAGGLRMSYRRFLGSAAVGGALWAACYVGLGALATALGDLLPGTSFTAAASMLIGLSLGWVVLLGTRRRLRGDAEDVDAADVHVEDADVEDAGAGLAVAGGSGVGGACALVFAGAGVGGGACRRSAGAAGAAGAATGNLGISSAQCVAPATVGIGAGVTEAGWVRAAQIPGPDRCHTAGYIRGSRRRPPRAGVGWTSSPRTRRRRHPTAVAAACPTVRNRRPVRPAR